jgi:hypothetical protein
MGPHATIVRSGLNALGLVLSSLITPCGGGAEFEPSFSKGTRALKDVRLVPMEKV